MEILKNRKQVVMAIIGVVAISAIAIAWKVTRPNPHYVLAKEHIEAGNFDEGESELRLCLREDEDDLKAKGLLAWTVLRLELEDREIEIEKSMDDDDAEDGRRSSEILIDRLLRDTIRYFTVYYAKTSYENIPDKESREELEDGIDSLEDEIKDTFRDHRIPFRNWDEFTTSLIQASSDIVKFEFDPDDDLSLALQAVAAAVAAMDGSKRAIDLLVDYSVQQPGFLALAGIAVDKAAMRLEAEAKDEGSFIGEEAAESLRVLRLQGLLSSAIDKYPSMRVARRADIPKEHREVMGESKRYTLDGNEEFALMLMLKELQHQSFDPAAVSLTRIAMDDDTSLEAVTIFDGKSGKFASRYYYWNGTDFEDVSVRVSNDAKRIETVWTTTPPFTFSGYYDEERLEFMFGVRRVDAIEREVEKPVTKYRRVRKYDQSYGYYYGDEPYTAYETTMESEETAGVAWSTYSWNPDKKELLFEERNFLDMWETPTFRSAEDSSDPDVTTET